MLEASKGANDLRTSTLVKRAMSYKKNSMMSGTEILNSEDYLEHQRKSLTDLPDVYGWAKGTFAIEVQNANPPPPSINDKPIITDGVLKTFTDKTIATIQEKLDNNLLVDKKTGQPLTNEQAISELEGAGYAREYLKKVFPSLFAEQSGE